MRNKPSNINSNDGRFHDGNPATGSLGTVVTATWLNEQQDFAQSVFEELKNVLALGGLQPIPAKQNQVAEAIEIAIRNVKNVVDSNTRTLQNVIPNSKKSSAVNSTSGNTVATSFAVKTAYDKALEANHNANNRVAKSGDTMTGELISTYGAAAGAFDVQHQRTAPFFVQAGNARGENRYFPYLKGRVGNGQSWESSFSVGYMTAGGWNQWGEGVIVLNEDNGWHKYWRFLHNGNFRSAGDVLTSSGHSLDSCQEQLTGFVNGSNYIKRIGNNHNIQLRWEGENLALKVDATELGGLHYGDKSYVDATIKNSDYGGINLRRRGRDGNWDSRIEALVDKRWKFWVQNSHEIYLPARGGTVALDGEVLHKAGDTVTGELISTYGTAAGAFDVQHQRTAPFFVQAGNARGENRYFPYLKGRVGNGQGWESSFSMGYMTAGGWNQWGEGVIVLNEDNGWHKYWRFLHNGDFRSAGDVITDSGRSLNAMKEVAVLTGTIAHGGTIPLPSGFDESQCRWMITISNSNPNNSSWDIEENRSHQHFRLECWTNGREVHARQFRDNTGRNDWHDMSANYIIIGVK